MKNLLLLFAIALITLTSCKKDDKITPKLTIEGFITDYETDLVLSGVAVEVITGERVVSSISDENGGFKLEGLNPGTYSIKFSKDGFLTSVRTYEYLPEVITENYSLHSKVSLVPLNDELNINVFKKVGDGQRIAATNQPYEINLGGGVIISGTTDENGFLHETGVPFEGFMFQIKFDFNESGINYKTTDIISTRVSSLTVNGNRIGDLGLISSNILDSKGWAVDDFPIDGSIEFNFTQPIDVEKADIYFYTSHTLAWSNGNKTLTITPTSPLYNDNSYYISLELTNELGTDYFYNSFYFRTIEL